MRFAIFRLDGDSSMWHPVTGDELRPLCDGSYLVEFSDADAMWGYLLGNSFELRWRVYYTLIQPELEEVIREGGHYSNGNYSVFCSKLVRNEL